MQRKVNVLQLGSPSGLYGAEMWIIALIKHLDPEKIRSYVASIRDEAGSDVPLCVKTEKLGFSSCIIESYGRVNFSGVNKLRAFIKENAIDILHTHGYKTDLTGLFAVRGTSCKIVTTPHGWTKDPDLKLLVYEMIDRLAFPLFDAVVPLSHDLFSSLRRIPGLKGKLHLVNNSVDTSEINEVSSVASEISSLKEGGAFVIGYIGRLTPGKGLDVLIKSVAHHGEPNWHVAIIGEGEQEKELKSMVMELNLTDKVTFFGFRPDRLAFLKGFDLFVLPSRSEGIPRCIMEAMGAGVAVVASDIPGCRYLVENEKTGLLFETDNPASLASEIKKIQSHHGLKQAFSDEGKKKINAKFSAARMAREYEELFLELAERR
ncbi:MAG: glycosyltransferase family 4 protein [Deltaproteobacteria bacterium]|nr:glycosyltransferase family 4 protein [Deltaproteobacteria bacterium]